MTNIKQRARELLTCDELRGRLPDEVTAFLREVVALEPDGYTLRENMHWEHGNNWYVLEQTNSSSFIPIYTLETSHDR